MFSSLTHLPTADLDSLRGHVMFVGAGPGDPSLLTMAAVTALNSADVVLANSAHLLDLVQQQPAVKLAPETLVTDLSASTEGLVPSSQARATLVRQAALGGRKVVRLVPGDPFLDGGAIAEAAALARTGMNFEVIPGVSSLTAIPEYAGVALSENSEVHYVVALDEDFFSHEDRHWGELPTIIVQT
ncbi:MAG: bifunctional uroporphyrinogen-III C-methyltransferase/uroporphyrinogen-III synthase, partial [Propionibacteriaceae bacterium]|nr:bifunctional uroporphyrinogen-III C-methyltransferase/uroporphyrinogen-III synthase [Propionibacteriaceae bacterium]